MLLKASALPVEVSLKSYERDATKMVEESKILYFSEVDNSYFTDALHLMMWHIHQCDLLGRLWQD